jgi:vacuolar-type H+-ATPase subunit C/Vma6
MKSVSSFASEDFVNLFQEILIDLPVGEYFRKFIDSIVEHIGSDDAHGEVRGGDRVTVEEISNMINDYSSSDIKVFLKKIWLASFHRWVVGNCNGDTSAIMDDILKSEADWETLQIIYNSMSRESMRDAKGMGLRQKYFNNLGHLYPARTKNLNECRDFPKLQELLTNTEYYAPFSTIPDPLRSENEPEMNLHKTIDDV